MSHNNHITAGALTRLSRSSYVTHQRAATTLSLGVRS